MADIHIIVISSVRPEPTSAGQLVLFRHLADRPGITYEIHGSEPPRLTPVAALRRMVGRLGRMGLRRFAEDIFALGAGRWLDEWLPWDKEYPPRTVVLTVAHGDGCQAALRFARRKRLPLVTIHHDWWPDSADVHAWCRPVLEKQLRALTAASSAVLCVCDGMRDHLGAHPAALVLPPLSAADEPPPIVEDRPADKPFTVLYSGNLQDYGPMLADALTASTEDDEVRLEVRGADPRWPENLRATMRQSGRWLDFAPRAELERWLAAADAFLIPMSFEPAMRRRMESCFPSKLLEFARFGKPLVVWGPDYCSAVRWGDGGKRAVGVTDSNPQALLAALRRLAAEPESRILLGKAARHAFDTEFHPERIQQNFVDTLHRLFKESPGAAGVGVD